MKNSRLASLALATSDNDALIVEALAERLKGTPGPACEALAARMAARPEPSKIQRRGSAWFTYGPDTATRRDGIDVRRTTQHPRIVTRPAGSPMSWIAEFPPRPGAIRPVADLGPLDTLADALEEVDQRWPLADWWRSVDTVTFVVGACETPFPDPTGFPTYCELPKDHADAHQCLTRGITWKDGEK